jgi:hypothetical protein
MATPSARRLTQAPARLEKYEQTDGVRLLQSLGAKVYILGTRRRKGDYPGTMQTPGIADVEAWLPRPKLLWVLDDELLLKWEVKRARDSRTTPDQLEYEQHCKSGGIAYVRGDLSALMRWLVYAGYLRADQLPHDRL